VSLLHAYLGALGNPFGNITLFLPVTLNFTDLVVRDGQPHVLTPGFSLNPDGSILGSVQNWTVPQPIPVNKAVRYEAKLTDWNTTHNWDEIPTNLNNWVSMSDTPSWTATVTRTVGSSLGYATLTIREKNKVSSELSCNVQFYAIIDPNI